MCTQAEGPRITKYLKSVMFYNSKIFTKSACQRLTHLFTQPLPSTRCIWLLHQKIIESWTQIPWHLSSFSRSLLFWEALWEVWQQIGVTLEFASLLSHWSSLEVPTSILLASQDALEVMRVTHWLTYLLTEWTLALTLLMWPWWVMIPGDSYLVAKVI